MADNEKREEPAARANEWEVVSVTASTYAATHGPEKVDVADNKKGNPIAEDEAETSRALFMSDHFVFPPSQHENLPLEPEHYEIHSVQEYEDADSQLPGEEGTQFYTKRQEIINTKGLTAPDEFPGIPIFDEKGNIFPVGGTEFEQGTAFRGLNLVDAEQTLYDTERCRPFRGGPTIGGSVDTDEDITEAMEPCDLGFDSGLPKPTYEGFDRSDQPCGAWWKRQAASFYVRAKEANTFWSIFVAAAVMGLVILGQQWQQERWQVLQLKWQASIGDGRMGRVLGPLTRFKDVIVGGQRQGSLIRGSTSTKH